MHGGSPTPSTCSTPPARMRGSPTQEPLAVRRRLSFGSSLAMIMRGALASVTGSLTIMNVVPLAPPGMPNPGEMPSCSDWRSQSQPTETVSSSLISGRHTLTAMPATWPDARDLRQEFDQRRAVAQRHISVEVRGRRQEAQLVAGRLRSVLDEHLPAVLARDRARGTQVGWSCSLRTPSACRPDRRGGRHACALHEHRERGADRVEDRDQAVLERHRRRDEQCRGSAGPPTSGWDREPARGAGLLQAPRPVVRRRRSASASTPPGNVASCRRRPRR